jgi:hypothetical protein
VRAIVIGVIVLACAVVGLDAFAGPFFSLAVREWPVALQGQRVVGAVEGPVKRTDEQAHVVRIASGFLGLWSLPVMVTPDTTIAVDGKLGWWGDLHRGLLVRVAYEVKADDRLIASRVDVLRPDSQPLAAIATTDQPGLIGAMPHLPLPGAPAPPRSADTSARADANTPAAVREPVAASREPTSGMSASPKKPTRQTATSAGSAPSRSRPAMPTAPSPGSANTVPPRPAPAPAPRMSVLERPGAEDGGAAIDWLLKEAATGR